MFTWTQWFLNRHTLHVNIVSLQCVFAYAPLNFISVKDKPHTLPEYGFSPVWIYFLTCMKMTSPSLDNIMVFLRCGFWSFWNLINWQFTITGFRTACFLNCFSYFRSLRKLRFFFTSIKCYKLFLKLWYSNSTNLKLTLDFRSF